MNKYLYTATMLYLINYFCGARPANLQKVLKEQGFSFEGAGTRIKNWKE